MNVYNEKVIPLGQELPSELQPKTKYYVQVSPTEFQLCFVDDKGTLIKQEVGIKTVPTFTETDNLRTVLNRGDSVNRDNSYFYHSLEFPLDRTRISNSLQHDSYFYKHLYNSYFYQDSYLTRLEVSYDERYLNGNNRLVKNTSIQLSPDSLDFGSYYYDYENNNYRSTTVFAISDRVRISNQVSAENAQYQAFEVVADAEGYLAFREKPTTTPTNAYNYIYLNSGNNMNTLLGGENYDFIVNQEWGANTFVGAISDGYFDSNGSIITDGTMNTFTGAYSAYGFRSGTSNTFYGSLINTITNYQQATKNYQTAFGNYANTLDYGTAIGYSSAANIGGISVGANTNAQAYINNVMVFYNYCLVIGRGTDYFTPNKRVSAEQELFVNIYKDVEDTSEPLLRGSFVPNSKYLKISGKAILNPNQNPDVGNDASYTKQVVAKADGTLGFKVIDTSTPTTWTLDTILSQYIPGGEGNLGFMEIKYNKKGNIVNIHVKLAAYSGGIPFTSIPIIKLPGDLQTDGIINYRPVILQSFNPATGVYTPILVKHHIAYLRIATNIPAWGEVDCTFQYNI